MADRSVLVRIKGDASDLIRSTASAAAAIRGLSNEIDTTNQRTAWMAQGFLALAPALSPLGASAVPALAGITAQMTAAGLAGGTLVLAFKGIGDTMKAVNEYQLEPTAENFNKMQVALEDFGPAGADFVRFLDSVGPKFDDLQMAAREGMFPGMEEGIREFMDLLPQAERIVGNVAEAIGGLSAEAGKGLAGPEFEEFFDYLEREAAPLLEDMGHTAGNFAMGFADMMVAFGPMSDDFSGGFRDMSEAFAEWADGLSQTEGFSEFIAYVQDSVPKALDAFEALAGALIQIIEAAAPIGSIMLPALEHLFDIIAKIADTPFGTAFIAAAAAMSLYGRAVALASITTGGLGKALFGVEKGFGATLRGADGAVARMGAIRQTAGLAAGGIGLLALSMTDLDEKAGISNAAMGALSGMMVGGPWGAAIGAAIGGTVDLAAANDDLTNAIRRADQALDSMSRGALLRSREELQGMLQDTERGFTAGAFFEDLTHIGDDANFGTAAMNELSGAADEARGKVSEINSALRQGGDVGDILAEGLTLTADAFHVAAMSAQEFSDAVNKAFAFLDKRAALRAARASIRDFTDALDEAPGKLRKGSAAFDTVQEALDNIARSSLTAAEHLSGMDRVNYLDRARDSFIAAARQMGLTARQARNLADDMKLLDKTDAEPEIGGDNKPLRGKIRESEFWLVGLGKKKSNSTLDGDNKPVRGKISEADKWLSVFGTRRELARIDGDASGVQAAANEARTALAGIPDETVWITARRRGTGFGAVSEAEGGTIPGTRTPYGDKVLAYLAPGEEVISNRYGQADRHRELLQAINSNAYANGGTVSRQAAVSAGGTRVIERVVERMPNTAVFEIPGLGRVLGRRIDQRIETISSYHDALADRD